MTDSATQLGMLIGSIGSQQQSLQNNAFPSSSSAKLNVSFNESLAVTGSQTWTAKYFDGHAFIPDHPVYGYLDSTVLQLDGDYDNGYHALPWNWTWNHVWSTFTTNSVIFSTTL